MKKGTRRKDEMRNHYDFTGAVRNKYARRYAEGSNVVVLDPHVARLFPNRQVVNETLRAVAQIVQIQERRKDGTTKAVESHRHQDTGRKDCQRSRSGGGR
jgi:hypothetical protein